MHYVHLSIASASHTWYMFAFSLKFISCGAVTLDSVSECVEMLKCTVLMVGTGLDMLYLSLFPVFDKKSENSQQENINDKKRQSWRCSVASEGQLRWRGEADMFGHVQRRESRGCWTKDDEDGVSVQEEKRKMSEFLLNLSQIIRSIHLRLSTNAVHADRNI